MDIPDFFTDKDKILNYDFSLDEFIGSDIDESYVIDNVSVPGDQVELCRGYFKSILLGYNHIFIFSFYYSRQFIYALWTHRIIFLNKSIYIPDNPKRNSNY